MIDTHPSRLKRIGLLLFNEINALDVVGPMEAFATACLPNNERSKRSWYELLTIGLTKKEVISESGLILRPGTTLAMCPKLDTIIIPGGRGLREARTNRTVAKWILNRAPTTRRIVSVCTGIFGLAPTGLLDNKTVTTHWRFVEDLLRKFPALKVDANALFLRDGHIYTSAGITAGIDLSLALIEEDFGRAAALMVARELVVFMKRPGGQEQYSEPLQFQIESTDRTHEVVAYIRSNLKKVLSVGVLRALLIFHHDSLVENLRPLSTAPLRRTSKASGLTRPASVCVERSATSINSPCRSDSVAMMRFDGPSSGALAFHQPTSARDLGTFNDQ